MSSVVTFSTTGKAQVTDEVGDYLVDNVEEIVESDSSNPGDPIYPDQTQNDTITVDPPDGDIVAGDVQAETGNIDELTGESFDIERGSFADNPDSIKIRENGGTFYATGRDAELASGSDIGTVINTALTALDQTDGYTRAANIRIPKGLHYTSSTLGLYIGQQLIGENTSYAEIRQADGANLTNVVEYIHDSNETSVKPYFGGLFDIKIDGNKANNTSGIGFYSEDIGTNSEAKDFHIERAFVDKCPEEGFRFDFHWGYHVDHWLAERNGGAGMYLGVGAQFYIGDGFSAYNIGEGVYVGGARNGRIRQVNARENGADGFRLASPRDIRLLGCVSNGNDVHGYFVGTDDRARLNGCTAVNNGQNTTSAAGFQVTGNNVKLVECDAIDTQGTATQNYGFRIYGANTTLIGGSASGNGTDIQVESGATDTELWGVRYGSLTDNGTRTRWNGVIGGGPLGGTDIGSLTGASAGDEALADGTTATTPYTQWTFNGAEWVLADGSSTITPA
ncbi:right-handed parallel beta-helix repeat-containing protein [Halomarina salina]|uniref:Right-handed parallel beta-helix repeat-containing protein n=1 Tax=Halomarina salina TaxID=1872699 RepID=A0ABD5RIC6_9EURY|nr:right-handed parallel beta-helix repeat-containing protein [Halomarina salina]